MSFGDHGRNSLGGSYASGGSRHSSVTKHVLASSISITNQHPAVKHLHWTFNVQLLCLVAFAVILFVLRRDSVSVLALFVDGLRNAEGRLLHAQAAMALVSAIIMNNEVIAVRPAPELKASFAVELGLLQVKVADLQDEQSALSIALGGDVVSSMLVVVPDGNGGESRLRVHDDVSWMQDHLSAISRMPTASLTLQTAEVAQLFNASDVLLGEVLPQAVKEFELRLISWLDAQQQEDIIVVACGLAVVAVLIGGIASLHIQRLANHRHMILDAIVSVASSDAKKLARHALLDAKEHLTLLVDADQADGDAVRELDGIDSDDEGQNMADAQGHWAKRSMRASSLFDAGLQQREQEQQAAAAAQHKRRKSVMSRMTDPAETLTMHVDDSEPGAGVQGATTMLGLLVSSPAPARTGLRRSRATLRTKKIKDSSTLKTTALIKLMLPTVIVFAFIAGLWVDWSAPSI